MYKFSSDYETMDEVITNVQNKMQEMLKTDYKKLDTDLYNGYNKLYTVLVKQVEKAKIKYLKDCAKNGTDTDNMSDSYIPVDMNIRLQEKLLLKDFIPEDPQSEIYTQLYMD